MNRREFLLATVVAPAVAAAPVSVRRVMNPRIVFFGMTLFRKDGDRVTAVMPMAGNHAPFVVSTPANLKGLGVTPKPLDDGLEEAHVDLENYSWGGCVENLRLIAGNGNPATLTTGLESRLPHLLEAAATAVPGTYKFNPGPQYFSIELSGGKVREATQGSTSPGTAAGKSWRLVLAGQEVIPSIRITDIAVFESESNRLSIGKPGGSIIVKEDELVWLMNFPVFAKKDLSPDSIEHSRHLMELVGFRQSVSMHSLSRNTHGTRNKAFRHPCLNESALSAALKADPDIDFGKMDLPPDSDPCFQARV